MTRFTSADVDAAHSTWGRNCGPGALAAICNLTLDEVRPLFSDFPGYTNPTRMFAALRGTGRVWRQRAIRDVATGNPPWPRYGLARIQWHGPWMQSDYYGTIRTRRAQRDAEGKAADAERERRENDPNLN